MPLDVPNLDDRTWAQLVDDARALIPRVAPAWTDHNVHDPGMTFIELFAWLAEMQLYQINRVSERHREAFARLAGVERLHRIPARVAICVEGKPVVGTRLPAGTQLTPAAEDDYARPLQLLARSLAFVDPISGEERRFESGLALSWG